MKIGPYLIESWAVTALVIVLSASLLVGVPLARLAGQRAGRRQAAPQALASRRERLKDTALFLAALIPSVLVWLAVMAVSFTGLTGFARDLMKWDHFSNILVPLSLDGISISFGAWAFVAVKRGRHPGRALKIVMAAALMSAVLNFVHGRQEYSIWAGSYLAFLSLAGMAMFHELLDQFMAQLDEDQLSSNRKLPRFGIRWLLAPVSTAGAWRAWIVFPAPSAVRPTVANALFHHLRVRHTRSPEKPSKVVIITYAEEELALFPDGLRDSSGKGREGVREELAVSIRKPSRNSGGGLPPQVNGSGRVQNGGFGDFPEALPASSGNTSGNTSQIASRKSITAADEVAMLVSALQQEPGLSISKAMKLLSCRHDTAKERLAEARAQLATSDQATVNGHVLASAAS